MYNVTITIDLTPYVFTQVKPDTWVVKNFTAFDLRVKSRFTERYTGKWLAQNNGEDTFMFVTQSDNMDMQFNIASDIPEQEQPDLIASFFDRHYDGLKEIGYEMLDSYD
jgi:hypothetical protein